MFPSCDAAKNYRGLAVRGLTSHSPALFATLAAGIVAAVIFVGNPDLDIAISQKFYLSHGQFVGQKMMAVKALRNVFVAFYFGCIALAVAGLFLTRTKTRDWLGLPFRHWVFMAACLAAGPGLVANLILKDNWGRARPEHTIEFGGSKSFSPALAISGQCQRHCSFVSGEASSIFLPFYAAAAILPQNMVALAVTGTVLGLAAGILRISQGAHFLSDVIFAGVFMGLTVTSIWHLMFGSLYASMRAALFGEPNAVAAGGRGDFSLVKRLG